VRRAFLYTHSGITLFPAHLPESRRVWDRVRDRVKQPSGGYRRRLVAKRCWNFRDLEFVNVRCVKRVRRDLVFSGLCGRFRQDLDIFWGVWAGPNVRSTGDGNSKGTTKLPSAVTMVQTDGPRAREEKDGGKFA
jgi:hypothetical protein